MILTKGARHGYHILVSKKADFAKLDKSRKFQSISEAKSSKMYAYHVSGPLTFWPRKLTVVAMDYTWRIQRNPHGAKIESSKDCLHRASTNGESGISRSS